MIRDPNVNQAPLVIDEDGEYEGADDSEDVNTFGLEDDDNETDE
jgi:hypothetical protein